MARPYFAIGILVFVLIGVPLLTKTEALSLSDRDIEQELIQQLFGARSNYSNQVRASDARNNATVVTVNLYVRSIEFIDDVEMEYGVQLTFRQQWQDDRLKYSHLRHGSLPYITLTESSRIWMPDLFFSNERAGHLHTIITPNMYVRIFPDGVALYSLRITLKLFCPMILKLYPMDKQTCSMRMASYAYTNADIIFQWKNEDPVQVTSDLHLPRFALEQFSTDYCNSHTNTGIYSCIRVDFLFKRKFSYYMKAIYIPCIGAVIIAWLSFWLEAKRIGRGLLVVSIWILMDLGFVLHSYTLPPVSYTMAVDVWAEICLTFVFFALCEFTVVHYLEKGKCKGPDPSRSGGDGSRERLSPWQSFKRTSLSQKIDIISRIVYPVIFILFVCMYWAAYLKKDRDDVSSDHGVEATASRPGMIVRRQPDDD